MQKLTQKTVLKIPLRTLETRHIVYSPMAFRIYALIQFHIFRFKNTGQNCYSKALFEK